MAEHQLAQVAAGRNGLNVGKRVGARRRIARVTDGGDRGGSAAHRLPALQRVDGLAIEDLAHQPEALVQVELRSIGGGDAGGLLATMLQGVQPQVCEPANGLSGREDADHPALLARTVRLVGGFDGDRCVHCGVGRCDGRRGPSHLGHGRQADRGTPA